MTHRLAFVARVGRCRCGRGCGCGESGNVTWRDVVIIIDARLILFIYFVHICIIKINNKINNKYYLRCRAGSGQGWAKVRSLALDPMTQCKSFAAGISRPPSTNHVVICCKSHQPQTRRQPQPQQRTQLRPQPSTVSCPPGIFFSFLFSCVLLF